jgi:hypothetical protein
LLDDSPAANLFDLDVSAPIPHEFQRALIGFADGDSSLDVLLGVHVPDGLLIAYGSSSRERRV